MLCAIITGICSALTPLCAVWVCFYHLCKLAVCAVHNADVSLPDLCSRYERMCLTPFLSLLTLPFYPILLFVSPSRSNWQYTAQVDKDLSRSQHSSSRCSHHRSPLGMGEWFGPNFRCSDVQRTAKQTGRSTVCLPPWNRPQRIAALNSALQALIGWSSESFSQSRHRALSESWLDTVIMTLSNHGSFPPHSIKVFFQ